MTFQDGNPIDGRVVRVDFASEKRRPAMGVNPYENPFGGNPLQTNFMAAYPQSPYMQQPPQPYGYGQYPQPMGGMYPQHMMPQYQQMPPQRTGRRKILPFTSFSS